MGKTIVSLLIVIICKLKSVTDMSAHSHITHAPPAWCLQPGAIVLIPY